MSKTANYFSRWFRDRGMSIKAHQSSVLNELAQGLVKPTVLAASPSAGKTLISIAFVDHYLKRKPTAKVLVLTHGQRVLRSQYANDVVKHLPTFTHVNVERSPQLKRAVETAQVIITLPQTIKGLKSLPRFDLVIIDEAHHYYGASMIETIIRKVKPDQELLLTGTPSPFVLANVGGKQKYHIIPVALNDLLDSGLIQDPSVENVVSDYRVTQADYNPTTHDLRKGIKTSLKNTADSMGRVLTSLQLRAKDQKPKSWDHYLSNYRKTLIACYDQRQAKQVAGILTGQGVDVALSTSDQDEHSTEIKRFRTQEDCRVLIVVRRGVLGFNLPELQLVVDVTLSHNIDRIYQLLARVIRKHPLGKSKTFLKLSPSGMADYTRHVMDLTLCLTDAEYLTKYNGKNFLDLPLPVRRTRGELTGPAKANSKTRHIVKSLEVDGAPAIRFFKEVIKKRGTSASVYSFTSLREVRSLLLLNHKSKGYWTKERCLESGLRFKSRSEWQQREKGSYRAATNNGWLDECTAHMITSRRPDSYWTLDRCKAVAKRFTSRTEWLDNGEGYHSARRNGWLDDCCAHMVSERMSDGHWTKARCIQNAKLYKTRTEWIRNSGGAYNAATRNGWRDLCCKHMVGVVRNYWTRARCLEIAKKYKRRIDWQKSDRPSYQAAHKNGWLKACTAHMGKPLRSSRWKNRELKTAA